MLVALTRGSLLTLVAAAAGLLSCPGLIPEPPPPPTAGCGKERNDADPFLYPQLLDVDGQERRYGLRVPDDYDMDRPYPVVLVFHGDADCAEFDEASQVCLRAQEAALAGRDNFGLEDGLSNDAVVVYVEGHNLNAFEPRLLSWDTFRTGDDNADFAFVDALLAALDDELCVDNARTFAVGFSGGGFFVDSLACLRGGLRAIATFEGGFEAGEVEVSYDAGNIVDLTTCQREAPAALIVHADDDTVVPPRYGVAAGEHFRKSNCCSEQTQASDHDVECQAFVGCRDGGDTVLCTPASADPPRTHAIWQPQGPAATTSFFQSFF